MPNRSIPVVYMTRGRGDFEMASEDGTPLRLRPFVMERLSWADANKLYLGEVEQPVTFVEPSLLDAEKVVEQNPESQM